MKDAFKRAMVHLWPNGTCDMSCPGQFRDVVRVFSMGWMEAMQRVGSRDVLYRDLSLYNEICAPEWMPDSSWDWTPLCDSSRN